MASSSKHLSDFLSSIGTKAGDKDNGEDEAEPDWLLESDEEEVRCSCPLKPLHQLCIVQVPMLRHLLSGERQRRKGGSRSEK